MLKAQWLSPPIEELHGRKVFTACQTNSGECISTGDFVHLLPADSGMELYVGRIESMYEDESSLKCIQVRWFYRPRDLQHDPPLPPLECEVYHTSYYDCQLIESVVGRCTVMHKRDYLRMKGRKSNLQAPQDQQHIYVCSFSYSIEAGLFIAVQEEVLAGSAPDLPYLDANDNANREISHEDIAVAKQLANALLCIDRGVPREVARADWSTSKRLPWVLKAKNAMTLEDLKQLLIDLESGLEIFKHENGWRKSVQDIASFDTLNNHIQYLKQNAQQKVDEAFKKPSEPHPEKQTGKRKALRTPRPDQYKWRTVKIGSQLEIEGASKKIGSGCAYEMDHTCPSPNSPIDLKCLRVMVGATPSYRRLSDATPSYRSLSDEKQLVEEPLAEDLWKSVEVMQDDVAMVLDSMGFSQAVLPLPPCEPAPKNLLALTDKTSAEDGIDQNSKENILLFQRAAAQVSSSTGLGLADSISNELSSAHPTTQMVVINAPSIPCPPSTEKQIISPKEEQDGGCGFRVWKPEGSFVSRKLACFQRECLA